MIKRIMSLILTMIMCLNVTITASADVINKSTEHIANVVYFVDFKDSNPNFMNGKFYKVKNMFDGDVLWVYKANHNGATKVNGKK